MRPLASLNATYYELPIKCMWRSYDIQPYGSRL